MENFVIQRSEPIDQGPGQKSGHPAAYCPRECSSLQLHMCLFRFTGLQGLILFHAMNAIFFLPIFLYSLSSTKTYLIFQEI